MGAKVVSVIVIGRNEAENLHDLVLSLAGLRSKIGCELVYVDSASSDDSVVVAAGLFDSTVVLADSPYLNASAGRYVGVGISSCQWLLFLDGDMRLSESFGAEIEAHVESSSEKFGLVGDYVHQFDDGSERRWRPERDSGGLAKRFGGAVLLHRRMLEVENWNPRLYSNEEVDLYTRLRARGFLIRSSSTDFICHRTEKISVVRRLVGGFLPSGSYLGKKFYGMGQLLLARIKSGSLASLIRWFPGPFVLWLAMLLASLLAMLGFPLAATATIVVATAGTAWRYSVRSVVYFLALIPQAVIGMRHYQENWAPSIARIVARE